MVLSAMRPCARICRNTCSQPVPLCFSAAIWSSVSGFGALPAAAPAGGVDVVAVLRAPFVVVVVVVGALCASNSARATFWLPADSFWYAPAAVGGGVTCASADAAPNSRRIAATCDASPISVSRAALGQYRRVAAEDTRAHAPAPEGAAALVPDPWKVFSHQSKPLLERRLH